MDLYFPAVYFEMRPKSDKYIYCYRLFVLNFYTCKVYLDGPWRDF